MPKFTPLFILSLSATLLMVGVGMIVALLPQRVFAATGSLESVGLIASAFAFAYLLCQLPIGVLSDRYGPKLFLTLGYITCGTAGLVFFFAQDEQATYIGRALQGLGEAPIWALGPALLSLAYPDAKGRAIGIYNATIHAGLALGPLLGLLITPDSQSSLPFLVFACLCFGAGIIVFLGLGKNIRQTRTKQIIISVHQLAAIFRQRNITITLLGVLLYGGGYGVFISVLPISLAVSNELDTTAIALLFVVFYAAISIAQLIAGPLSDRFGRWSFMMWGMAAAAIGIMALQAFSGIWVLLPLGIASAGLGVFCVASITVLNENVSDTFKGTISGIYYFFWATGYMIGPLLIGALATISPLIGYSVLGVVLALYSLMIWFIRR
ncbi:MAG: MFS transporter [Rhizobiales bacterium]|nr:MFS transporter [Hyphomicrobiales bacterium]